MNFMMRKLTRLSASLSVSEKDDYMTDIAEKMARDIAVALNGGEFNDGRWYGEGHRTAWRNAVKPYAYDIERLRRQNDFLANDRDGYVQLLTDENSKLRAALDEISNDNWFFIEDAKGVARAALKDNKDE